MRNKTFILLIMLFAFSSGLSSQENLFRPEQFISGGDTLNYRILYPRNFSEEQKYPVVLFLHGAGERGNDNKAQLIHGSELFLEEENRKGFPAIVIFPQVPKDDYWANVTVHRDSFPLDFDFKNLGEPTPSMAMTISLIDSVAGLRFVDRDRVYVGGLSMGGMGTYEIIARQPQRFAAAFAICGGADPAIAKKYPKGFPIWIFHGEKDNVVPAELSKTMARAINSSGGNAKLSLYPNDNHNSWDSAFAEPYLLSWLFSHTK